MAASLGVKQKAVAGKDEDAVSLGVQASRIALLRAKIKPENLGAILVGSESHPYAVKPSGSIVGEILGAGEDYLTVDLEFACKAGTSAMILIAGLIEAGLIEVGLAIGGGRGPKSARRCLGVYGRGRGRGDYFGQQKISLVGAVKSSRQPEFGHTGFLAERR